MDVRRLMSINIIKQNIAKINLYVFEFNKNKLKELNKKEQFPTCEKFFIKLNKIDST